MRITIDNEGNACDITLFDTDGDGIITIEFGDGTGVVVKTIDPRGIEMATEYDMNEFKQYLKLVLNYMENV
jgi:hypothetical protein